MFQGEGAVQYSGQQEKQGLDPRKPSVSDKPHYKPLKQFQGAGLRREAAFFF
jgi:hypothetical protein